LGVTNNCFPNLGGWGLYSHKFERNL
jgi:hypothetical protein